MAVNVGKQERDTIWRCNISVRCDVYKSHLNCRFAAYEEELRAMASQPYFRLMSIYLNVNKKYLCIISISFLTIV